jgi:hypothetical protein
VNPVREVFGLIGSLVTGTLALRARRRDRAHCWHHNPATGESWVNSQLINTGAGKMFWCRECDKTEFV